MQNPIGRRKRPKTIMAFLFWSARQSINPSIHQSGVVNPTAHRCRQSINPSIHQSGGHQSSRSEAINPSIRQSVNPINPRRGSPAVKVPDRVCPPLVGGGTRDRGAFSNIRPHTSAAFSSQFYNTTTFPGKSPNLAGGAGTIPMGKLLPNQ